MLTKQKEARIYLADQRSHSQNDWLSCYHTFNEGAYFHESRTPFGNLHLLNDTTLKAGHTLWQKVAYDSLVLLLPVVGGLTYKANSAKQGKTAEGTYFVEAEEAYLFALPQGAMYSVSNPFENDWVKFLHIGLCPAGPYQNGKISFKAHQYKNKLFSLLADKNDTPPPSSQDILIGNFDGREKGVFTSKHAATNIFVFVIEGAFEVQNRLMEQRDGLALYEANTFDFEALSNNAILLIIEQGVTTNHI